MITIKKSPTADTRTCDFSQVTKEILLESSKQHIADVELGLRYFKHLIEKAIENHDFDKLTGIDWFHSDFKTGFKETGWWDNHRKVNRHHLSMADGVPDDVNLIDVLDYITDCVMAGMARAGNDKFYPIEIKLEVLQKAFDNTASLLKKQIVVEE